MNRRAFLAGTSAWLTIPAWLSGAQEARFDVAIIGASVGGVAAALGALRNGLRVVMTEETGWIGGQLTSQGVPPDEHPWIEIFGRTRAYASYREDVRQFYRHHYPLTDAARQTPYLNPGDGSVSGLTHEPRVSWLVLEAMLSSYLSTGHLTLLLKHRPLLADADSTIVRSVTVQSAESGRTLTLTADYFIDATETGDLLPLTKTEYVTGFESRAMTTEPSAPDIARPQNMQAITWCFAAEYMDGEDHTIDKPAQYAFWRDYVPQLQPVNWPGKLLSWEMSNPITLKPRAVEFIPGQASSPGKLNLWHYRRIVSKNQMQPGACRADVTLVNWPQNDYWLGNPVEVPTVEARKHLEGARQLSLSLLYWMQTEAPRSDGKLGWRGLRPRGDIMGTADGLAQYPYIRESRRIRAEFTILEQHVSTDARALALGRPKDQVEAEAFKDSVGVGSYRIDLHPSTGGDNYIDVSSLPFQIPLGALIPRAKRNLIAACKNIGSTHITNGCYRLHPVEWNIGESAGCLVAEALRTKQSPTAIRNTPAALAEFQKRLAGQGIELAWPKLRPR